MGKKVFKHRSSVRRRGLYRSRTGNALCFLFLIMLAAFMCLPLLYSVVQSLKPIDEIFAYPPRFFVKKPTLSNFVEAVYLSDSLWVPFSRYLFNSVAVSVIGTAANVFIATFAAYALAKGTFPGRQLFSNIIVWTLLFSGQVTAIPQYIVLSKLGLINTYGALILPALAGTMGVFLMRQFMLSAIPDSVLEAARIDGASEATLLVKIVFPCVRPGWLTLIIFSFQSFWGSNGGSYIYDENLKMLPNIASSISAGGMARAGATAAVGVILMIPPIVIFVFSQSSVMETMSHSGLK